MSQALPQLEDCVCCENAVRQRSLNPFVAGAPQGRLSSSLVRGRDWILIRAGGLRPICNSPLVSIPVHEPCIGLSMRWSAPSIPAKHPVI